MANKEKVSETLEKVNLDDAVSLLLIGLVEEEGKLRYSPGPSVFMDVKIYEAVKTLSEEFPEIFPTLNFVPGPMPYSPELEKVLSNLGSSGIATVGGTFLPRRIEPEMKKAVLMVLLRHHSEEDLRTFLPIVQRFDELMEEYGKSV